MQRHHVLEPAGWRAKRVPDAAIPSQHGQQRPKNICLFGLFGMNNYGNDGSLEATLIFLRQTWPDANYACICVDPEKIQRRFAIATAPISWSGFTNRFLRLCDKAMGGVPRKLANWVVAVNYLRNFDVLIVPGTSALCDCRSDSLGVPYAVFRWTSAAKFCGTKLYFINTGAGPIHRRLNRAMLTCAARSAHYRSFRDFMSKNYLTGLGIDTRMDAVYPDLAFRLPTPPSKSAERDRPTTIGIGLMDYNGWHGHAAPDAAIYGTYLMKMVEVSTALISQGYRIRLLAGESADQRTVADLSAILAKRGHPVSPGGGQIVTAPVTSLHDLMRQIQDTDIVVASRFHNVICALKMAKPTLAIGYEAKHGALMADFGFADFCQHIERFDVGRLLEQIALLLRNAAQYEAMIKQRLAEIDSLLAQQEQRLTEIM